jgi:acyl-CoA thioester hydrolase
VHADLARWRTRRLGDGVERASMTLPLRVAGYDIDVAGVVNNAVYVRWLEDLRTIFMARWLSFEQALARGLAPTLVRIEVDYRSALRLGDAVEGELWFREVGRATGVIETEIRRRADGRICAHALQTVCFVDQASGRPVRILAELRASLAPAAPSRPDPG